jgi:hypothetical protein
VFESDSVPVSWIVEIGVPVSDRSIMSGVSGFVRLGIVYTINANFYSIL